MSSHSCSFFHFFYPGSFIGSVFIVPIFLVCDTSIMATCPSIPAARFAFYVLLVFLFFFSLFVVVLSSKLKTSISIIVNINVEQSDNNTTIGNRHIQSPISYLQ